MNSEAFITAVAEHIVDKKLVPFIGAGLSCHAGYPSWKELIESILDKQSKESSTTSNLKKIGAIRQEINTSHLQNAADFLSSGIPGYKHDICKKIGDYENGKKEIQLIQKLKLFKWNCDTIITTNYDSLIESSFRQYNSPCDSFSYKNSDRLISDTKKSKIVHLHGKISTPDEIIVSSTDISKEIWTDYPINLYLRAVFLLRKILFIGYSIQDPHIADILKNFGEIRRKANIYHYAILGATEYEEENWEDTHHLKILRLPSENGYKTSDGLNLIDVLSEITKECDRLWMKKEQSFISYSESSTDTIRKLGSLASIQNINLPIKALLELIVKKGLEGIDAKYKTFTIHLVEGNEMRVVANGGANKKERLPGEYIRNINIGLTGKVYVDRLDEYYAADVDNTHGYVKANPTTRSEYVLPLRDESGYYFGVLNFESSKKNDFDDEASRKILACISQHISIALQNKKKFDLNEMVRKVCLETFNESSDFTQRQIGDSQFIDSFNIFVRNIDNSTEFFSGNSFSACLISSLKTFSSNEKSEKFKIVAHTEDFFENREKDINKDLENNVRETIRKGSYYTCDTGIYLPLLDLDIDQENYYTLCLKPKNPFAPRNNHDFLSSLELCMIRLAKHLQFLILGQEQFKIQKELDLLKKIIDFSKSELDESVFLYKLAETICAQMQVDWCFIYLHNPSAKYFDRQAEYQYDLVTLKFAHGDVSKFEFNKISYLPDEGLTGKTIKNRNYIFVKDSFSDPDCTNKNRTAFEVRGIEKSSFLGQTIKNPDVQEQDICTDRILDESFEDIIGVITLGRTSKEFDNKDIESLKRVSIVLSKELQRRSFLYSNKNFLNYVSILNELPKRFIQCTDKDKIFESLSELIPKYLGEQYYSIFELHNDQLSMVSPKKYLEYPDNKPPIFKNGEGLTGKILSEGPKLELNLKEDGQGMDACKKFWTRIIGTDNRYFIGVPIKHPTQDGFYGVLTLNGRKKDEFDPTFFEDVTLKVITAVAFQITLALSRIFAK
jgi:hypothetical protein